MPLVKTCSGTPISSVFVIQKSREKKKIILDSGTPKAHTQTRSVCVLKLHFYWLALETAFEQYTALVCDYDGISEELNRTVWKSTR